MTAIATDIVEPQFHWENREQVSPSLWVLKDFLSPDYFDLVRNEMRCAESFWSSRYGNRLVCETENWFNVINLAAALIPKLNELTNSDLCICAVRGYKDLSDSFFFKHFDSPEFLVNVQIYMIDFDEPSMGTQFCLNQEINQACYADTTGHQVTMAIDESEYFTVPFRPNWGYINHNRDPKVHKTLPVPPGRIRESVHFNYGQRVPNQGGLEGVAEIAASTNQFQQVMWQEWQERSRVTNTMEWWRQQQQLFEQQQVSKR